MTTTPDPKTVRELARKFLLDDDLTADELNYVVYSHTGYGVGHEEFQAWRDAVDADVQEATVTKTASWPDEQPQDDGDVRAVAAMSDARLERLAGLAELPCTCQDADCGNYTSALTAQEARELVAEAKRARAALEARDAKVGGSNG